MLLKLGPKERALGGYGVPGVAGGGAPTRIVDLGTGGTGVGTQIVNGEIEDGEDGPKYTSTAMRLVILIAALVPVIWTLPYTVG